jgi:MerR family Zn(II)-responsive transcriptional regulator of zntA
MHRRTKLHRIGGLAADAGVTADTLRYYEREGLLPPALRTVGGFRVYPPDTVQRVQFIREARAVGMSLADIRTLVQPDDCRCVAVRDRIAGQWSEVDERLRALAAFRQTLQQALDRCDRTLHHSRRAACPVVGRLGERCSAAAPTK